jgi:hypothetical protein
LIVESYGEEQAVLMDVVDYRLLRAVTAYHHLPPHTTPGNDLSIAPSGLSEDELAGLEMQMRWNQVIMAYLDEQINLGRTAALLGLSRYELDERFRRLDIPRRIGPATVEEARAEVSFALNSLNR